MLRLVFLGTPEFALPTLEALLSAHDVAAVITRPDRPAGRGRRMTTPPVAETALRYGLEVLQPQRLREPGVVARVRALEPRVLVTAAYGKIIPPSILEIPPLGCVNVHPSLLPRYRGAAPIQAAIENGDTTTGVSIIYQTADLDAGPIILQREIAVEDDDTGATLEARLARAGAAALIEALALVEAGTAPRIAQDDSQATYAGKLAKEGGRIDWTQPAPRIVCHVRAMDPWPTAYTERRGGELKIWRARALPGEGGTPGEVVEVSRGAFVVRAGDGRVEVLEVQPESGKRMPVSAYLLGHPIRPGERLGT